MNVEELIAQAQGTDGLSANEIEELQAASRRVTYSRIDRFFNCREGILLRRAVRFHKVVRHQKKNCGLCGGNVKGALRPQTSSYCETCGISLCTVPRPGETGLSCFQEWHCVNKIEKRVYMSSTAQPNGENENERENENNENNGEQEDSPASPPKSAPTNASDEDTPQPAPLEKNADEEEEEADQIVRQWCALKKIRLMLANLTDVMPQGAHFSLDADFATMTTAEKRKVCRKAMLKIHPDKLAHLSPTPRDELVSRKAFEIVRRICRRYDSMLEREGRGEKRSRGD